MPTSTMTSSNVLVLTTQQNGITVIPTSTPLTRLNYFDGKFLRADDLRAEQLYLRNLVRFSNKSSGHGVAHGFSLTQGSGDQLKISPGLAVNAEGQVILLTGSVGVSLAELIDKTRQLIATTNSNTGSAGFGDCVAASAAPPSQILDTGDLFVITVAPAEALCGQEDVYGKLCEDACVTSTDRPLVIEGIVLRARPLVLGKPLPVSSAFPFDQSHLRSRVASAVFAQEPSVVASLISKAGLESHVWCLGAQADGGAEVPLAVVDRSGASVGFLDAWTVRREKIDTVAKRYWQWRMAMRPWDVYLAQILQFQCQLADLLQDGPQGPGGDPCSSAKDLVKQAAARFDEVTQFYGRVATKLASVNVEGLTGGLSLLSSFQTKLADFTKLIQFKPQDRRLLRGGIIETPSAGYLPVIPGDAATVNAQVRQWMGEGVDLRFCVVRPDFVPHALEEAQHMERISLTQGLDDPQSKPQVDVLVPNGEILKLATASPGQGYEAFVQLFPGRASIQNRTMDLPPAVINLQGAATTRALSTGGAAFYLAGASPAPNAAALTGLMSTLLQLGRAPLTHLAVLSNAANTQPAPVGTIADNPALFSNLSIHSAFSVRSLAAVRAGVAPAAAPPVTQQVSALWVQLSSAENPFLLELGETAALSLRLVIVLPGNQTAAVDYRLQGDLRITQRSGGGTIKRFRGAFSGTYVINDQSSPNGGPLNLDIDAGYDAAGNLADVIFSAPDAPNARVQVEAKTGWQGDPQQVGTRVVYRTLKGGTVLQEFALLNSTLTRNDHVLEAGQSSHTAALSALDVIAAALQDSSFSDSTARLLFPPPPPPTSDLLVKATLDWVLFHRRRTKTCATETVATTASARRYLTMHLRVPDRRTADLAIKALVSNDSTTLPKLGFRPIDTVEFAAGTSALNTLPGAIQTDWATASPPPSELLYAAIATQGAATADSLAFQRLGRMQDVISHVLPPDAQAKYEVLASFPTALPAPGLDGEIFVITIPAPKFTGHQVLRTTRSLDAVFNSIQSSGLSKTISGQVAADLGLVQFLEHTPTPQTNDFDGIQTRWTAAGGGNIVDIAVVYDSADTSDSPATREAQSLAIAKQLETIIPSKQQPISGAVEPLVNSITIVQVSVAVTPLVVNRTARLLIWRANAAANGRTMLPLATAINLDFKPDGTLVKRLTAAQVKALQKFGATVRLMEFYTREATPDEQAKARATALAKELEAHGSKPSASQTGTLPVSLEGDIPADAASAQDIVFLEVVG